MEKVGLKKSFERLQKVAVLVLCVVLAGSFFSCAKKAESYDTAGNVTGTVIGNYYDVGEYSLLVMVDKKYPIGKTIEYVEPAVCFNLPKTGTYQNVIQVQPLPLLDYPKTIAELLNKRISFSFRELQEEDWHLFITPDLFRNALCAYPDVPFFFIVECKILK